MKIRFSAPNHLELAASREELAATARRIEQLQSGVAMIVSASTSGSPAPYAEWLQRLSVQVTNGPVEVAVSEQTLQVTGSLSCLRAFSSFFVFDREDPEQHSHFEYFEGNEFVSPRSLPLVIAPQR